MLMRSHRSAGLVL